MSLLGILALTVLALACAVGFLATFEPGSRPLLWRLVYGGAILACLAGVLRLVRGGGEAN